MGDLIFAAFLFLVLGFQALRLLLWLLESLKSILDKRALKRTTSLQKEH